MPGEAIVTIGDKQWVVDLATTAQELASGLGGLPFLPQGTGMLFDMGMEQIIGVTTEPMLFPIDVVFISGALTVLEAIPGVPPGQRVTSVGHARYFLEVNSGEASGVAPGDPVTMQVVRTTQAGVGYMLGQLVNLMMGVVVLGLVGSMARGMVVDTLPTTTRGPRPVRRSPVLYGPGGEILLPRISSKGKGERRRPTREQVRVEVWEERDRLHIGIQDRRTGDYIASWWDGEAREMFEQGFFQRGRGLEESVLAYAEEMGLLQSTRSESRRGT